MADNCSVIQVVCFHLHLNLWWSVRVIRGYNKHRKLFSRKRKRQSTTASASSTMELHTPPSSTPSLFHALPTELLLAILSLSPARDVPSISRVCKKFALVTSDQAFWRAVYTRDHQTTSDRKQQREETNEEELMGDIGQVEGYVSGKICYHTNCRASAFRYWRSIYQITAAMKVKLNLFGESYRESKGISFTKTFVTCCSVTPFSTPAEALEGTVHHQIVLCTHRNIPYSEALERLALRKYSGEAGFMFTEPLQALYTIPEQDRANRCVLVVTSHIHTLNANAD